MLNIRVRALLTPIEGHQLVDVLLVAIRTNEIMCDWLALKFGDPIADLFDVSDCKEISG